MQEIRGVFEDGTVIEYNSKTQPLIIYREKNSKLLDITKDKISSTNTDGNISEIRGYYNEIKYWIKCLQNNKYPERVTPEDAKESLEIVRQEIKSAEIGKEILL
jgi:predicted dehydrogenase